MTRRYLSRLFGALALGLASLCVVALPVAEAATYAAALKTARMTTTASRFDGGTLEVLHSNGTTVLATWTLSGTQSGGVSGSVWTVAFSATAVNAAATGTATTAQLKRSAGNGGAAEITAITVGTSGQEINFNNTSWTSGQQITITGLTFTHS